MATYVLVVARFYEDLAARLQAGARAMLEEHGCAVETIDVPGAFELAAAAQYAAASGRFDGVVCLGAVIRGETDHYDQALARSGGDRRDSGAHAARAALALAEIRAALASG